MSKADYLRERVESIDISRIDAVPLLDMMSRMSYSARDLARAARLYADMVRDPECTVVLCLSGSLFSAGLRMAVVDLVRNAMVDVIVSTGANIVDQDFFEALGFRHYLGSASADDAALQAAHVDRIYDTFIDEDELRMCDDTVRRIADGLEPRAYSSREFIREMGRFLERRATKDDSVILAAFQSGVPIFVPAFSDCSAGFGLMEHQHAHPGAHVVIDSVKDFAELTRIKAAAKETGLLMIGGGVPKNFAQDCAVGTAFLGSPERAHKYAVQVTVADARDGGLSGSTLREAHSWGKVSLVHEQMVYCEATIAFPLIAAYALRKAEPGARAARHWGCLLDGHRSVDEAVCVRHNGHHPVKRR
jgi:deoxyhypusine synthase